MQFEPSKLKKLREERKLSYNRAGLELKTSGAHIKSWESGESKPSVPALEKICDFYGVEPGYFFVEKSAYK
jgi:transcriptional regulator with XRE-family HTH domain